MADDFKTNFLACHPEIKNVSDKGLIPSAKAEPSPLDASIAAATLKRLLGADKRPPEASAVYTGNYLEKMPSPIRVEADAPQDERDRVGHNELTPRPFYG